MENITILTVAALLGYFLLLRPIKWGLKLLLNSGAGLLCLTALNAGAGTLIPINAVTVLTAGTLGLPGIGLLAMLELAA